MGGSLKAALHGWTRPTMLGALEGMTRAEGEQPVTVSCSRRDRVGEELSPSRFGAPFVASARLVHADAQATPQ